MAEYGPVEELLLWILTCTERGILLAQCIEVKVPILIKCGREPGHPTQPTDTALRKEFYRRSEDEQSNIFVFLSHPLGI